MSKASSEFEQLQGFLKEMFQFDDHDLDFGIYRIVRLKRKFIESFIDGSGENSLQEIVIRSLSGVQNSQSETSLNWLTAFAANFGDKGRDKWKALVSSPEDKKYLKGFKGLFVLVEDDEREQAEHHLKTFLETRRLSSDELETKVYNHLLNFFELYYQNGDFGYNTRATSAFKVPYETDYDGSDTMFHWKHKDSYYIKTGNGFHSVRCEINGKWLEFRLTDSGDAEAETTERNNNKDTAMKHYKLVDIQSTDETDATDGSVKTIWQVRFALSTTSTSKVDIYTRIWQSVFTDVADPGINLTAYLYKKPGKGEEAPGKPAFKDLKKDFDKADSGQMKGMGQLRIKLDKYLDELSSRDEFSDLGSNGPRRKEALANDVVANALWQIDKNLNKFYVGNDADYFIHKDLLGFLSREKSRFIKYVIFSDLDALLHAGEDNTTTLIARAFNQVADKLIEFLAAIEDFQKGLFELKKKVVDTHYMISVGKIPEPFHERVFACEQQLNEWRDVFKVDVKNIAQLAEHPTLVVDTSYYRDSDPDFQDDLLSLPEFDNLDEQTDGLLINSENWQALNLLQDKFREQIKTIYIDPPYNTGSDGFLYKDSFKHSSWTSMVTDRLIASAPFMKKDGVIFASIDENEDFALRQAMELTFGRDNYVTTFTWEGGRKNDSKLVSVSHELVHCFVNDKEYLKKTNKRWLVRKDGIEKIYTKADELVRENNQDYTLASIALNRWYKDLDDREPAKKHSHYRAIDKHGVYFPSDISWPGGGGPTYTVIHPETGEPCKVPSRGWMYPTKERMDEVISNGLVHFSENHTKVPCSKTYLRDTEYQAPPSVIYKDGRAATKRLRGIIGNSDFKNPKDEEVLQSLIKPDIQNGEIVLDYFAGSGSSAHSVMNIIRSGVGAKFINVEMGKYFSTILKKRVKRVMYAPLWKKEEPKECHNSKLSVVIKIQLLEQYEDLLDNLQITWDNDSLPSQIPVKYLFRPEQNQITSSLDVSHPFDQQIQVGKAREAKAIDLMETWLYLQGYWVKSRRVYREFDRTYLAVETTHGVLVLFRDIEDGEDDTAQIQSILACYVDDKGVSTIQSLELNHDADLRKLEIATTLISSTDFMRGAQWN